MSDAELADPPGRSKRLVARRSGPITGDPDIPGDKSISHRALILGALAEGRTRIAGLLESDDVLATANAVRAFGAIVERGNGSEWLVTGCEWRSPTKPIDCGNSGTTARLLIGAAVGFDLEAEFRGDESLSRRPMRRVTQPLERMGARFSVKDRLPLGLSGGGLSGIEHVNDPPSAQVKSAILIAGLRAEGPVSVIEPIATRDHTEIMLGRFGCEVRVEDGRVSLGEKRQLTGMEMRIPADPSSSAFAIAGAAMVPASTVTIRTLLLNPRRSGFLMALQRMGADLALSNITGMSGETVGDVRVRYTPLFGAEFTAEEIPSMIDEIPALAMVAATARGETRIEGLGELRHKESDRLAALAEGLKACGVQSNADGEALVIEGGTIQGGTRINCHGDHRIAMAFAVLGLVAKEPVEVDGAEMIATSFPHFASTMRSIGASIDELE